MREHPLRALRRSRRQGLRPFARDVAIDFRRLSLLERGLQPKADEIERLAAVLQIDPGQLRALLGCDDVLMEAS